MVTMRVRCSGTHVIGLRVVEVPMEHILGTKRVGLLCMRCLSVFVSVSESLSLSLSF